MYCIKTFLCVCAWAFDCMLPRGHVQRSQREATLCGLHVTGKPSAVRSHWGASVHAAAAGSKQEWTHTQVHMLRQTSTEHPKYTKSLQPEECLLKKIVWTKMSAVKNSVIVYSPSCCSKPLWLRKTKAEILKNVLVALFHAITINGDWSFKASKRIQNHHKSCPYYSCTILKSYLTNWQLCVMNKPTF